MIRGGAGGDVLATIPAAASAPTSSGGNGFCVLICVNRHCFPLIPSRSFSPSQEKDRQTDNRSGESLLIHRHSASFKNLLAPNWQSRNCGAGFGNRYHPGPQLGMTMTRTREEAPKTLPPHHNLRIIITFFFN